MSRYDALTALLLAREDPVVTLTFAELDEIVGGLPASARKYGAWWANKVSSQPHAAAWLNANRRASPDFRAQLAVFLADGARDESADTALSTEAEGSQVLEDYVESTISLERDLEDHIARQLASLEPGLTLVSRQHPVDVGRIDIVARDKAGGTVIIELKVGEAKDAAIGQVARYLGWYARTEGTQPRAMLIAGGFSDAVKYAALAIPGLRLVSYRLAFEFTEERV